MAYNKAPTKEELRKWGRLSRKGDKIKFVDIRFVYITLLLVCVASKKWSISKKFQLEYDQLPGKFFKSSSNESLFEKAPMHKSKKYIKKINQP